MNFLGRLVWSGEPFIYFLDKMSQKMTIFEIGKMALQIIILNSSPYGKFVYIWSSR